MEEPSPKESPTTDPLLGSIVAGRYRVLDVLGEGGMGVVYRAEHELIQKPIALKVLRPQYSSKADLVTRFQREAISASRIKHQNVLDVFDFGQLDNGCFFLAMEFLEGHDLGTLLAEERTLDAARCVHIGVQMSRALAAAHARGVVHRDMKPENVFLHRTAEGEEIVKIVDFGIAQLKTTKDADPDAPRPRRLTKAGMIFGTPEYMAPEQATGQVADLRVDVYAVGIILYEMCTGVVPYSGDSFMGVLSAHVTELLPAMNELNPQTRVSAALQIAIAQALEKQPSDRFQSMSDLSSALLATPEGRSLGLEHLPPPPRVVPNGFRPSSIPPPNDTESHCVLPELGSIGPAGGRPREQPLTAVGGTPDETLSDADLTITERPPSASRGPRGALRWAAAAIAIGALLAASAVWLGRRAGEGRAEPVDRATASQPSSGASPSKGAQPPEQPSEAPPDEVRPPEATSSPPARVVLDVDTEPQGALVFKGGFQVCDTTPCQVSVEPEASVELSARKGRLRGEARVLAQGDQRVVIALSAPHSTVKRAKAQALSSAAAAAPPTAASSASGRPAEPKLCEIEVDGLKILRPCSL